MPIPLIDIIAGTRPNFMKIASILHAIKEDEEKGGKASIECRFIHTGQHYDENMSGHFLKQLNIPPPDYNLDVRSGSAAQQTGAIMERYETLLRDRKPDLCLVVGDVNSTLACSLTAQKSGVKVAHVEGGLRSGDWSMPEEINRLATDSISNYFFVTSVHAQNNLMQSGVGQDRIFFVGNTMIDTVYHNRERFCQPIYWEQFGLSSKAYILLTLHRPGNVDDINELEIILDKICKVTNGQAIIFPIHPRTQKKIETIQKYYPSIHFIEPQPYLEFMYLVQNAMVVMTDSGGISEETTVLNVPCFTLRDTTERPETVEQGTNVLIGRDWDLMDQSFKAVREGQWKTSEIPEKWDGVAGQRIVQILKNLLSGHHRVRK